MKKFQSIANCPIYNPIDPTEDKLPVKLPVFVARKFSLPNYP